VEDFLHLSCQRSTSHSHPFESEANPNKYRNSNWITSLCLKTKSIEMVKERQIEFVFEEQECRWGEEEEGWEKDGTLIGLFIYK